MQHIQHHPTSSFQQILMYFDGIIGLNLHKSLLMGMLHELNPYISHNCTVHMQMQGWALSWQIC